MLNRFKATLVKMIRMIRTWGPLVALAVIVPGGSLLALLILRHQQSHPSTP